MFLKTGTQTVTVLFMQTTCFLLLYIKEMGFHFSPIFHTYSPSSPLLHRLCLFLSQL